LITGILEEVMAAAKVAKETKVTKVEVNQMYWTQSISVTKSMHLTFDVFGPWLAGQQRVNTLKRFPRSGQTFFRRASIHHPSFTLFCLVAMFRVVAIAASLGRRWFSFLKPIAAGTLHNDVHVGRRQPAKNTPPYMKKFFRRPISLYTYHRIETTNNDHINRSENKK
jgi:hypothetical protein